MPAPSKLITSIGQALSIKVNNLVYTLKDSGKDIIVLSLGESFFDLPLKPMDDLPFPDLYHYTHSRGILSLRQKIAEHYNLRFGVNVNPDEEIIITAGAKAAIQIALLSIVDPDDEVVIHEPTWVSYTEQVKLCHAKPVLLPYWCTTLDYENYATKRTKAIIINNPHNPRGAVMTRAELQYLTDLATKHDAYLLADEAYSDFVLDNTFLSAGLFDPQKAHVVICNSISKNFGISGWRLGYVIANRDLIAQILKLNQHIITCPAAILQYYVAKHFDWFYSYCRPQIIALAERRKIVEKHLNDLSLDYLHGTSTFYFFVSISPTKLSSYDFCMRLLNDKAVSAVPGIGYGQSCDSFVRISIGTEPIERIITGLQKMKDLIEETS